MVTFGKGMKHKKQPKHKKKPNKTDLARVDKKLLTKKTTKHTHKQP